MSVARNTVFLLLLGSVFFSSGCDTPKPGEQKTTSAEHALAPTAPEDPVWTEAIEAVRQGDSVEIRLRNTAVTDEQLSDLTGLDGLRRLNLPNSQITDAGLETISSAVPQLELLRLGSPRITDAGMSEIPRLKQLRFLHLIHVPITDAGLKPLHEMTWLESFYLDGGKVTDEGLSELIKKLPELHFHRDQQHLPDDPHKDGH